MIFDALKKFKRALKKYQIYSEKPLEKELLAAILLLISVQGLNARQPGKLFNTYLKAPFEETKTDLDLFSQCLELYGLVSKFCPESIEISLPMPRLDSIIIAKNILGEDLLSTLANDLNSIGFVYQIFNTTERQVALAAVQTANKEINKDQLIAFTQLYTPAWVVDFLLANTVFPVLKSRSQSSASERFAQWLLEPQLTGESSVVIQDLKIMDPACGAGHFLIAAFDLLLDLYASNGIDEEEAIRSIILHNIYGADIDDKALWITSLALLTKCLMLDPTAIDMRFTNLCWSNLSASGNRQIKSENDVLGSISKLWIKNPSHPLGRTFEVVVTNPPYIGRKLLSRELKVALQESYPNSHVDLSAAFITRSLEMLSSNGRLGVITQASLLTLPSYKEMRSTLSTNYNVLSLVNCGTRVFPLATGEKINSVLLIAHPTDQIATVKEQLKVDSEARSISVRRKPTKEGNETVENEPHLSIYIKLKDESDKAESLKKQIQNIRLQEGASQGIRGSFSSDSHLRNFSDDYLPASLKRIIFDSPKLASLSEVRQGLATTDNNRFVRYWWDVDARDLGDLWVPYCKGAGSERWFSDNKFVVRWGKDGAEIKQAVSEAYPYLKGKTAWVVKNENFYFRSGLCFSFINKKRLAVRRLPPNCIFDVASSAIFPNVDHENFLLAYLNSSLISSISNTLNPTINLQVGDIKRLPLFDLTKSVKERLSQLGEYCYEHKLSIVRKQNPSGHSETDNYSLNNSDVESFFKRMTNEIRSLATELIKAEQEIDTVLLSEISKLVTLDKVAAFELANWVNEQSNDNNKAFNYGLTPSEFAARFLSSRVSQLLFDGQEEQIFVYPMLDEMSLPALLGLNGQSVAWLENALQKSLVSYFDKPSVLDLGKTLKTPSRYFSVRLANTNLLLLASSRAFRNTIKALENTDQTVWNKSKDVFLSARVIPNGNNNLKAPTESHTIFSSGITECEALLRRTNYLLSHKIDWTTKDLIQATNQSLALKASPA